jgi:hypothetical protein
LQITMKSKKLATYIGTALGVLLLIIIFGSIYL